MVAKSPIQKLKLITSTDVYHQMIHEGRAYIISHHFEAVADDASVNVFIRNGKYQIHLTPVVGAGGKARVRFFENVTISDNGTKITPRNLNREFAAEQPAEANEGTWVRVNYGAALSDNGIEIDDPMIFGASQTASKVGGAQAKLGAEWVIPAGSLYAIQVTNKSGGATDIEIRAVYYEYKE